VRRLILALSLVVSLRIPPAGSTPLGPALLLEGPQEDGGPFGQAVAAAGSQLLVGATSSDPNDAAAYLYDVTSGALLRTMTIPLSEPFSSQRSLGFSGDIVIVGRPTTFPGSCCGMGGAIDLFDRASGRHLRRIGEPTTDFGGYTHADFGGFAQSVAGVGGRILTGAPEDFYFPGFGRGGIAYLFEGATGELAQIIENPNPEIAANFGMTVAATRDALFVAAPYNDTGGVDAGVVYAFDPSGTKLLRIFRNPDAGRTRYFGAALAVRGTKLLVGAPDLGPYPLDWAEGAYLFDWQSGRLLRTFTSPVDSTGDRFGVSLALVGSKVAIGAPGAFPDSVFVFDGKSGELVQTLTYPLPPPEHSYPLFGTSLAAVGSSLVVAAPNANTAFRFARACGDGRLTLGERCDDGNRTAGDGCSARCQLESCGDGVVETGEECDDGNCADGDGCDTNCTATRCGNGVVATGEACDDGNATSGDGCDQNCTLSACGNGIVAYSETCDDGNVVGGDGCSAWCSIEGCGNQIVDAGESCEPWDGAPTDYCDAECRANAPIRRLSRFVALTFAEHRSCTDCDHTGTLARVGSHVAVAVGGDPRGSALLFDLGTGDPLWIFEPPPPFGGYSYGRALAAAGEKVLVGEPWVEVGDGQRGVVHVFDPTTGTHLQAIRGPEPQDGFGISVGALGDDALVADATHAAVYLIDADTGDLVRTFLDLPPRSPHSPYVLTALGPHVLVGGGGVAHLLDGRTGARRHTFGDGTDANFGRTLAVLDGDVLIGATGAVQRYDGATGELVRTYPGYWRPLAAANGRMLVNGPECQFTGATAAYLLDAETGETLEGFCGGEDEDHSVFMGALIGDTVVLEGLTHHDPTFTAFSPCTDGVLVPGEECDDGNDVPGDGCEPDCRLPRAAGSSTSTTLAAPATTTSTVATLGQVATTTTTVAPVVPGPSCSETPGIDRLRCILALDGLALSACAGVDLPDRAVRRLERARTSLERAEASEGTKRAPRLLARVAHHLSRAARLAERARVPRACAEAVRDVAGTARTLASKAR
jgi:cysteine-rich repeat protein